MQRRRRYYLHRIQRAAGHSNEADLQCDTQSVRTAPARLRNLLIRRIEREKLIEIEGGQLSRELF